RTVRCRPLNAHRSPIAPVGGAAVLATAHRPARPRAWECPCGCTSDGRLLQQRGNRTPRPTLEHAVRARKTRAEWEAQPARLRARPRTPPRRPHRPTLTEMTACEQTRAWRPDTW